MRKTTRKVGADMTNALLWAAFSVILLVSVLGLYQSIKMSSLHKDALNTITQINREMSLMQSMGLPDSEVAQKIQALYADMPVPGYPWVGIHSNSGSTRVVRYGLVFYGRANDQHALGLCTRLTLEQPNLGVNVSQGLLGENYSMAQSRCVSSGPTVSIVYYLRADRQPL